MYCSTVPSLTGGDRVIPVGDRLPQTVSMALSERQQQVWLFLTKALAF